MTYSMTELRGNVFSKCKTVMEGSVLFRYHKSYIIHKKLERGLTALPYLHFRLILINYSQDAVISFKEVSE